MDVWMIVVFVYPFIIMTLHTILQIIRKKNGKNRKLQQSLLYFGQVILPIMFIIFVIIFWIVAYIYKNNKIKESELPPFQPMN
jgi:magnesium-transporting ATPase (P-type)